MTTYSIPDTTARPLAVGTGASGIGSELAKQSAKRVGIGGAFVETDLQAELNPIELNIASSVHLAKRVVPDMVARHQGRILFTSLVDVPLVPSSITIN